MKNFEELVKEIKKSGLSLNEKESLRERIFNFVRENPVRENKAARHVWGEDEEISRRSNTPFLFINNLIPNLRIMPIVLVITLLAGAGVSYGAEASLPGEALYPVKVNVNEKVLGWVSLSEEARANWEARLAARRLEEAEKLVLKGRLDVETKNRIEANFEAHADRVKERVEKIEKKEHSGVAADVSSNFEVSLEAHERILDRLAEEKEGAKKEIHGLNLKVRLRKDALSRARSDAEAKISAGVDVKLESKTAAEGRLKAAENKIAEVKQFVARMKKKLEARAVAEAEARIKVSDDLVREGKFKLEAEAYGEAFVLFQRAHRVAQEAKLLIEVQKELKIEVRIPALRFNSDINRKIEMEDKYESFDSDEDSKSSVTPSSSMKSEVEGKAEVATDNGKIKGEGGVRLNFGV